MENSEKTSKGICIGKARMKQPIKNCIPLFFAIDGNYLPFFTVTLQSVIENSTKSNYYKVHVLHAGVDKEHIEKIKKLERSNIQIEFVDVSEKLQGALGNLQLRDYYTCTTYYRIFIANMFPEYDKALYLDSDTVVLDDVAALYKTELGDNLVGATTDQFVASTPIIVQYAENGLGIPVKQYFNAGVIIMNLKKFRDENFYEKFCELLAKYRFVVAQDQDYLNVICKDRVEYFSPLWNVMPVAGKKSEQPKLIHFNLTSKPWHYDDVLYQEYFWEYAKKTEYYDEILKIFNSFTPEMAEKDKECEQGLIELCREEAEKEDNYYNLYGKNNSVV